MVRRFWRLVAVCIISWNTFKMLLGKAWRDELVLCDENGQEYEHWKKFFREG